MPKIPIDSHDTLNVGSKTAPHQLTVVMNLSCRYCKKWWQRNLKNIDPALKAGQLALHVKFWTKDKAALRIGNVAHQYVDFEHPEATFEFVKKLIHDQNQFKRCQPDQVPEYLTTKYQVEQRQSGPATEATTKELQAAGVRGIPTIVL
ncbi:thioredoxin domain-containing protein, partial [Lactobacillaceae bacterium Melli_B3]